MTRKIRVFVVDDSAIIRRILTEAISAEPDMEIIGTAPNPCFARDKIHRLRPDVVTLDLDMPCMDGITFLRLLMQERPVPVIIVSSLAPDACSATLEALRCGAIDVIAKPTSTAELRDLRVTLAATIRAAAASHPQPSFDPPPQQPLTQICAAPPSPKAPEPPPVTRPPLPQPAALPASNGQQPSLIAIGASTGGTVAIQEILRRLPVEMPPILITQHIPPGFSSAFAERLNRNCALEVREAADGDVLRRGLVLLAPGNRHLVLRSTRRVLTVELDEGPEVGYLRPSVDVMFSSIVPIVGASTIAVLLTGMGADGAQGMLELRRAGATTIAQDEATCVIYGMPREAVRLGAVDTIAPLPNIASILRRLSVLDLVLTSA